MANTNNGKIVISDSNSARAVCIDTLRNEISCSAPGGVYPVIKLSCNGTRVLKINKKSVSTCSVEMLAHLLKTNTALFDVVYMYTRLYRAADADDVKKLSRVADVTLPAFYASFNDDLTTFVEFFQECSPATRRAIISDHICYNHDAKMNGVISLSTFVGANKFCQARCNNCDNAICKYCYADSLTKQRDGLKNKLRRIHAIMTTIELCRDDIPALDNETYKYFRLEAFGDLNNVIQVKNYNLIAACNPDVNFTLWTKNPGIIQAAIDDGMQLPKNLVIGLSSLYLNKPELDKARRYSFIRFLFTVYDDGFISEHNITINCGARHCITCGVCYKALHETSGDDLVVINERKK